MGTRKRKGVVVDGERKGAARRKRKNVPLVADRA